MQLPPWRKLVPKCRLIAPGSLHGLKRPFKYVGSNKNVLHPQRLRAGQG